MAAKTAGFRIIRQLVRGGGGGHVELQTMTIVIIIRRLNGTRQTYKKTNHKPTF
jgi:hypothetical protein